jgi:hypothetical protein
MSSWGYLASNLGVSIQFIFQLEPRLLSLGASFNIFCIGLYFLGNDFDLEDDWQLLRINPTLGSPELPPLLDGTKEVREQQEEAETEEELGSVSVFVEAGQDIPDTYKFWNYCPDDLKPEDIPALLAEYKRLALVEYNLRMDRQRGKAKEGM